MTAATLINRYKEESILNAPPEKMVTLLYDGVIRNLHQALQGLNTAQNPVFGLHIGKAQAIVSELLNGLDHEVGGEISKNLEKLYLFVIDRLIDANIKKEGVGLQESIEVFTTLKEGWSYAVQQQAE